MFVSPMLLQKLDEPPIDDDGYITELKLDGIRLILSRFDGKTKLYTRHNNDITAMFPEIAGIQLPDGIVLDGELIAVGDGGKPDFEAVMKRFKTKKLMGQIDIQYAVFDILYFAGEKVTSSPLIERKGILSGIIPSDQHTIVETRWIEGFAGAYFNAVQEQNLEGIVIKNAQSRYKVGKRSEDWLKIINYKYAEVYIAGLRKNEFGVALTDNSGNYLGVMEFMPPQARKYLYQTFTDHVIKETKDFIAVEPYLRCKVKYRNLTSNKYLRTPSFVEWVS